jgi:malonate decarboxylase beta subunit
MIQTTHSANPVTKERRDRFLSRRSVIEMRARERARALLDRGSFRELLGPFDRLESPWLPRQGIVPESDDGVIIARGQLAGQPAVIMAIEGAFQGGGMGEVSASKIAGALALARRDCESGKPILPVLLLETGGVRLQEANLGEAAVAEIHAEIIALRRHVPVIGVITGMVGCFGGMSITAGLCSYLVIFPQGRLELNGPEVIEQEAGIDELDASDKGIHLSLAAAADAYATARMAGRPVVALIVGTALSGGLLAHGDQAHRLLALDAPGVIVQAMRKASAARITRRTVEELDELGKTVIPMAYDIRQFAKLGLLHELIAGIDADAPSAAQVEERVAAAIADIRKRPGDLTARLDNPEAKVHRAASIEVRKRLAEQWDAS